MPTRRRGFALLIAVLLAVVGGLMITLMLDRMGSQQRSTRRQLEEYSEHHLSRGVAEVLSSWIKSVQTEKIQEFLGENGHALDIRIDGGRTLRVHLEDGQGTVLTEHAGLQGPDLEAARAILSNLRSLAAPSLLASMTRADGPVAVSLGSAPEVVVQSVVRAVVPEASADTIVRELAAARSRGALDAAALGQACDKAQLYGQDRQRLQDVLTGEPTLWKARVEMMGRLGGVERTQARYEALVSIPRSSSQRQAGATDSGFQPMGPFLRWRRVERLYDARP